MNTFEAKNRKEWRNWLDTNHSDAKEIWLIYYKKHTGKQTITYKESVEEAICFGWIDGIKKRIDDEKYAHRFTKRKRNSKWSPTNIGIAERMIKTGLMTRMGHIAFKNRKEYDENYLKIHSSNMSNFKPEFERELKMNVIAWKNFNELPPSHRKQYILWINSAKKNETKQKRFQEAIKLLEDNKKLGMK